MAHIGKKNTVLETVLECIDTKYKGLIKCNIDDAYLTFSVSLILSKIDKVLTPESI